MFQNSHFWKCWSVRAHLLEFTNQTASPWKVCCIRQIKRDKKGGRSRLGSQLLEEPWLFRSQWMDQCGSLHVRAWQSKGIEMCPRACSTKATLQLSQHSTNCAMLCRNYQVQQALRCHPALHRELFSSRGAAVQGKGMEPFPEGSRVREQLWCAAVPACTAPCLGHHPWCPKCVPSPMCVGPDPAEYSSVTAFLNSWKEATLKMMALI